MSTVEDERCESVVGTTCVPMPVIVDGRELVELVETSVSVADEEVEVGGGIFTTTDVVGVGVVLAATVGRVVVAVVLVVTGLGLLHKSGQTFAKFKTRQ